jgi:N-ethylmaleimide reductase
MESKKEDKITLFDTYQLGDIKVNSRIGMCALTRMRCDPKTGVPNDLHVKYYSERAEDAAFVLTECTAISPEGNSFPGAAGIYTKEQIEGWKKVTEAVHKVNGKIILQIWHCGRSAHKEIIGTSPIAPSSNPNRHQGRTGNGFKPYDEPQEMSKKDIETIVGLFEQGAKNAKEAGFDGIELHSANGYLIDQFLRDGANKRTDEYGGSVENRCRFPLQVIDKLIEVFGAGRVGLKISPGGRLNDMFDSDPVSLYKYYLAELGKRRVAFVEVMKAPEFRNCDNYYGIKGEDQMPEMFKILKPFFTYDKEGDYKPTLIGNNSLDFDSANEYLQKGEIDMVTFGRYYISNPDLVLRYKNKWELTPPEMETFYSPGEKGYITYSKYAK